MEGYEAVMGKIEKWGSWVKDMSGEACIIRDDENLAPNRWTSGH